jgi:hypothetical protein
LQAAPVSDTAFFSLGLALVGALAEEGARIVGQRRDQVRVANRLVLHVRLLLLRHGAQVGEVVADHGVAGLALLLLVFGLHLLGQDGQGGGHGEGGESETLHAGFLFGGGTFGAHSRSRRAPWQISATMAQGHGRRER